jgi:1-acyl-sn-glycerol-3-phosphate acyltransferase
MEFSFRIYTKHFQVTTEYKEKKKDSIIFASNHGNSFHDAFSIIFSDHKILVFLTRGGIFGSKLVAFWLDAFYMLPIYRKRDGIKAVAKNHEIMEKCYELIKEGRHPVAMFPEGNHNMKYGLRPLQKGIARLAFNTLEKYPDLDLKIIPIGVNYSDPTYFRANVLVKKGAPIYIKPFYDKYLENKAEGTKQLLEELKKEMAKLQLFIPADNYEEIDAKFRKLRVQGPNLQVNFEKDKKLIEDIVAGNAQELPPKKSSTIGLWIKRILLFPIWALVWISNLIPSLIIRYIIKKFIGDPHFIDAVRYAAATFLFPIMYFIQALILYFIIDNGAIATLYFLLMPLLSKFYYEYLYR